MSLCYGMGILGAITQGEESLTEQILVMERFAALGVSHKFREIIKDSVYEFAYKNGFVDIHKLPERDATPILYATKSNGGSAPASYFPDSLIGDLMIPGYRGNTTRVLEMPGSFRMKMVIGPLRNSVDATDSFVTDYKNEANRNESKLDFYREIQDELNIAREHRLLYHVGP